MTIRKALHAEEVVKRVEVRKGAKFKLGQEMETWVLRRHGDAGSRPFHTSIIVLHI